MSNTPKLKTRRPTGKPPWPMLLVAGVEKAGKSYGAALFSASDLIDRTLWIEIGEGAADQYGAIPGARYEIVEHDGTYRSIAESVAAAVAEPRENGRPHAIVIDSMTELWDMLSDEAQLKANERAKAKAAAERKPTPVGEAQITVDLWNVAKKRWRRILDALRVYDGPVILLTRLESVAVMDGNAPAKNGAREWKVRAEKNLPFEADAIVKMVAPQECFLTGVRSTVLQVPPGTQLPLPQFTIDGLLRKMGLDAEGATAARSYTAPRAVVDSDEEPQDRPAQHERGQSRDEWSTPEPPADRPAAEPVAVGRDVDYILGGLRAVRGIQDDAAMRVAIEAEVRHQVDNPYMLTAAEVARIRTTLEAERDAKQQAGPGPVGSPTNPEATQRDQKMMNALLGKAGFGSDKDAHAMISRVLQRPLTTRRGMSRAETNKVSAAMNRMLESGEMPPPWEPPAAPAGDPALFDELLQMIGEVQPGSEDALLLAQHEIEGEAASGRLSQTQLESLRVRLADQMTAVAA